MTHYREDVHRPVGDVGSSALGWLFALVIAAALAIGAWYVLATSGTPSTTNATVQTGFLRGPVTPMPSERAPTA